MGTIPDDALSYKKICEISNEELNIFLARKYFHPIPTEVSSADEMLSAGKLLAEITNSYSYLMVLFAMVDAQTRVLKKEKAKKDEYTEMVGKRNTISAYIEILRQSYTGLSREITTRQEALKEINMSKSIT